ncbi:FAD/NAD(P)-binding oxidoreductase [Gemmobacter lanyuensis]
MSADLVIIGAGPAGMAAARVAAEGGLSVTLLDEQERAGGQIYRNVGAVAGRGWLGADYARGGALVQGLDHPGITHQPRATVWRIDARRGVIWSRDGQSHVSPAAHVLIATGAQERPVPFPGWTLPGLMPAGAAQILMKQSGMVPDEAILSGAGPLLYLVAAQMIAAGAPPVALVETPTAITHALPKLPRALFGLPTLIKGLGLIARIRAAGIPWYRGAADFRAETTEDGRIRFDFTTGKQSHSLTCDLLLTHLGVIPQSHLTRSMGLAHEYDAEQGAWRPTLDPWGQSSEPHVFVAGDGGGIGGAEAARARARWPRWRSCTRPESWMQPGATGGPLRSAALCRARFPAAVPRCSLFRALRLPGPAGRDHRLPLRGGYRRFHPQGRLHRRRGPAPDAHQPAHRNGPCQGRMCETTVIGLIAEATDRPASTLGPGRIRTPSSPSPWPRLQPSVPSQRKPHDRTRAPCRKHPQELWWA